MRTCSHGPPHFGSQLSFVTHYSIYMRFVRLSYGAVLQFSSLRLSCHPISHLGGERSDRETSVPLCGGRLGHRGSRPKLDSAQALHEDLAPLPQPRASAAICRRIWSREHRASCGERMRCPSRPRARLSASSATSRSTVHGLGARARSNEGPSSGEAGRQATRTRFFSRGRLPQQ